MFEQTFKNIDDVLWKEAGCTTELDYTEQTSWLLFLKYLDDLEQERSEKAELSGESYAFIIEQKHRWSVWAAPKDKNGKLDHDHALTGDDLINYVNGELFPYLQGFKARSSGSDTIEYKIGEIFSEIKNRFQSGYGLRDALEYIDELRFRSQQEKHELSHLYEAKIKNMGNAGRNGGEYYTPRPLIRAIIQVVKPKIGEKIYDSACGSAGFLCESYDYLRRGKLTTKQLEILQKNTFTGKEKKSLAYVIGIMNMILHGIDAPNIIHTNTLFFDKAEPLDAIQTTPIFNQGKSINEQMATKKIWYYQLDPGRSLGKTNPLNDDDLREFVELQATFAESEKSWFVDVADIDQVTFDLSVKNPNKGEEVRLREPQEILDEIAVLDLESAEILDIIGGMI